MSVADGATTRRDRMMEMLQWIQTMGGRGVSLTDVALHMSLTHGLTARKTQEYVHEMQQGGVLIFQAGRIILNEATFNRLIELQAGEEQPKPNPFAWRRDAV